VYTGAGAQAAQLVDRFGGLGDTLDEAKRRMGLSTDARVQLYELPRPSTSLFGTLLGLFGSHGRTSAPTIELTDLPVIRELLRGLPGSVLVSPQGAHARLPYEIVFE
jgi:hypothetical protein